MGPRGVNRILNFVSQGCLDGPQFPSAERLRMKRDGHPGDRFLEGWRRHQPRVRLGRTLVRIGSAMAWQVRPRAVARQGRSLPK